MACHRVEHPLHDEWWAARDLTPTLDRIDVPAYLGCDWQNVPLHLPSTFRAFHGMINSPEVRIGMLGEFGLTWPWESLHFELLAWFDHWLQDRQTGILDGEPIRYFVPGADGWRTTPTWPPPGITHRSFGLRTDGTLSSSASSVTRLRSTR